MSKSIIAFVMCTVFCFGSLHKAYAQVIENDVSLEESGFFPGYVLTARLAQAKKVGGNVSFGIEDLGQGEYQVSFNGIAQLIAAFDVEPDVVFNASYILNNDALTINDGSVLSGIVNLAVGESFFLGYWDDQQFESYEFESAVDSNDGFGWAEIRRNADGLELLGSATAVSKGIVVGTTTQAGVLLCDVNLDGVVDLLDIAPFVDLIQSGTYQCEGDANQDGLVDLLDIGPFIVFLSGG